MFHLSQASTDALTLLERKARILGRNRLIVSAEVLCKRTEINRAANVKNSNVRRITFTSPIE